MTNFDPNRPPYQPPQQNPGHSFQAPIIQTKPVGPRQFSGPPQVLIWQKVYIGVMTLLYSLIAVAGILVIVFAQQDVRTNEDAFAVALVGGIYIALGVIFAGIFVVGLFWTKGMGGWIYNIVLIAFGMTNLCTLIACIPLLIYWIKAKDYICERR